MSNVIFQGGLKYFRNCYHFDILHYIKSLTIDSERLFKSNYYKYVVNNMAILVLKDVDRI